MFNTTLRLFELIVDCARKNSFFQKSIGREILRELDIAAESCRHRGRKGGGRLGVNAN